MISTEAVNAIEKAWNGGLTLSEAYRHVNRHSNLVNKSEMIAYWKKLRQKYGCGSIPLSMLSFFNRRWKREEPTDPHYRHWLGLEGTGKQLREIIAEGRKKSDPNPI